MRPRPLSVVPVPVLLMLAGALAAQLAYGTLRSPPQAQRQALPPAPPAALLQVANLGEPLATSRLLMLYLQAFDDQPGASIPLRELDYRKLGAWLERALELDPRSQYPLLAAGEVYGAVNDPERVRLMLDFIYRHFEQDPDRRWPWLAHAAVVAKHRLHDLPLARRYAQAIRLRATGASVPAWARELDALMRQDTDELDSARLVIGGLIDSGQIEDAHELELLSRRLERLSAPGRHTGKLQTEPGAAPIHQ
ncbi:MAG: hypothetical protein V4724_03780 [Pseudomonadota bacterium]